MTFSFWIVQGFGSANDYLLVVVIDIKVKQVQSKGRGIAFPGTNDCDFCLVQGYISRAIPAMIIRSDDWTVRALSA
jgi:hypothetical protein